VGRSESSGQTGHSRHGLSAGAGAMVGGFHEAQTAMTRRSKEFFHEGKYAAEVPVELIEDDMAWSPYLSPEDVRKARRGSPGAAARRSCGGVEARPGIRVEAGGGGATVARARRQERAIILKRELSLLFSGLAQS
jgi:hypothetical protein